MSRHRQRRQELEQSSELPEVLRELFSELDRETCRCFQAVTSILRRHYESAEQQHDESRRNDASARR